MQRPRQGDPAPKAGSHRERRGFGRLSCGGWPLRSVSEIADVFAQRRVPVLRARDEEFVGTDLLDDLADAIGNAVGRSQQLDRRFVSGGERDDAGRALRSTTARLIATAPPKELADGYEPLGAIAVREVRRRADVEHAGVEGVLGACGTW